MIKHVLSSCAALLCLGASLATVGTAQAESYPGTNCQAADVFTNSNNRPPVVFTQNGIASSQTAGQVKVVCTLNNFYDDDTDGTFSATVQSVGGTTLCTIRNVPFDQGTQVFKTLSFSSGANETKSTSFNVAFGQDTGVLVMDCRLPGPTSKLFGYAFND